MRHLLRLLSLSLAPHAYLFMYAIGKQMCSSDCGSFGFASRSGITKTGLYCYPIRRCLSSGQPNLLPLGLLLSFVNSNRAMSVYCAAFRGCTPLRLHVQQDLSIPSAPQWYNFVRQYAMHVMVLWLRVYSDVAARPWLTSFEVSISVRNWCCSCVDVVVSLLAAHASVLVQCHGFATPTKSRTRWHGLCHAMRLLCMRVYDMRRTVNLHNTWAKCIDVFTRTQFHWMHATAVCDVQQSTW